MRLINNLNKPLLCLILLLGFNYPGVSAQTVQVKVSDKPMRRAFPLVSSQKAVDIYIDQSDYKVVNLSAHLFAEDVERVTSLKPNINTSDKIESEYAVIIGTIGKNKLIDQLIKEGKIGIGGIENKWESFIFATLKNPFPGVKQALVITGSDRRGTAYGVFTLSEEIGVSPWYWWADVHPVKRQHLYVEQGVFVQGPPSVKYRGIFINDEGFGGLNIWAKKTYDTETGDIGPKTYAKVFELLLRLKANYCWPAMHACTKPFYYYPENPVVADDYAIVIGTSHCEQMHCNTMTEWDVNSTGPWNYKVNRDRIKSFWNERINTTHEYENTYTLGMRGTEDIEMEGAENVAGMVNITQQTIDDQRQILSENIKQNIESIPQILCTYKEVLVTYQNGLEVPEDVTLLWADDNHGYTRQLCTPDEQKRSGGSGVYYHLSLLGTPEGYLWLNTISPSLVAYEMTKAYHYGADRIWMFNIGDIKPHEKELTFALQLAWDINRWTPENTHHFIKEWSAQTFGEATAADIAGLMERYYNLAAAGKPEHCYRLDYSLSELNARIDQYRQLSEEAKKLRNRIPETLTDAYYELIEYPIFGCRWMNERNLLARRSLMKAAHGEASALDDAKAAIYSHTQLDSITRYYNEKNADGKWNHIMNWHPFSWGRMPEVATSEMIDRAKNAPAPIAINLQNLKLNSPLVIEKNTLKNKGNHTAPNDSSFYAEYRWNSEKEGKTALWIFATIPTAYVPSLKVAVNDSAKTTTLKHIGNIWHTQAAAPIWYNMGEFLIQEGENRLKLALPDSLLDISKMYLGLYPPSRKDCSQHIMADQFSNKKDGASTTINVVPGLGLGKGVSIMPFTAESMNLKQVEKAPWIEYTIKVPAGPNQIDIRTLPTQRIHQGRGVRYAASVNNQEPVLYDIQADEFTPEWQDNVISGFASRSINYVAPKEEEITLRIYLLDPGVVLRDIVIN